MTREKRAGGIFHLPAQYLDMLGESSSISSASILANKNDREWELFKGWGQPTRVTAPTEDSSSKSESDGDDLEMSTDSLDEVFEQDLESNSDSILDDSAADETRSISESDTTSISDYGDEDSVLECPIMLDTPLARRLRQIPTIQAEWECPGCGMWNPGPISKSPVSNCNTCGISGWENSHLDGYTDIKFQKHWFRLGVLDDNFLSPAMVPAWTRKIGWKKQDVEVKECDIETEDADVEMGDVETEMEDADTEMEDADSQMEDEFNSYFDE